MFKTYRIHVEYTTINGRQLSSVWAIRATCVEDAFILAVYDVEEYGGQIDALEVVA